MGQQTNYIKKKALFPFFKSGDFNKGRVNLCAIYILLSHINELKEETDRLLQGYEGVLIGMLKHKAKVATKAFEEYVKEYESHIDGNSGQLCDATIDMTSALDVTIEQNRFFLQEGYKAIGKTIEEQIEKTVNDEEQLKKEQFAGFEIFDPNSRRETLQATLKRVKTVYANHPHLPTLVEGVEKGFNIACDYINELYLKS